MRHSLQLVRHLVAGCLVASLSACVDDAASSGIEDGEHDDVVAGKADNPAEGSAEAKLLLAFVNDPTTNDYKLVEHVGLTRRLAQNIVEHLRGPDGVHGTVDDTLFGSIAELDAVPYLGPASMRRLLERARETKTTATLTFEITGEEYTGRDFHRDIDQINAALTAAGLEPLPATLTVGARDDRAFLALEARLTELHATTGRYIDIAHHWDPSEYQGLCYAGPIEEVERVIDDLYGSVFSPYMGVQGVRYGAYKKLTSWFDSEEEWVEFGREMENDDAIDAWLEFDTSSNDFLIMTDGGQQGDGSELFAVLIPPCE